MFNPYDDANKWTFVGMLIWFAIAIPFMALLFWHITTT